MCVGQVEETSNGCAAEIIDGTLYLQVASANACGVLISGSQVLPGGTKTFVGPVVFSSQTTFSGSTFSGPTYFSGSENIMGGLSVSNGLIVSGSSVFAGPVVFSGSLSVPGNFSPGQLTLPKTDRSNNPGSQTQNSPSGFSSFPILGFQVTITNSLVVSGSIVQLQMMSNDLTALRIWPSSIQPGSFKANLNVAATAVVPFSWIVV